MMACPGVEAEGLHPIEDAPTESLESHLAQLTEDSPVGFGVTVWHSTGRRWVVNRA